MEAKNPAPTSGSSLPGRSLYSLASNGKLVAPVIFVITTLILGIASRGLAFVREDVMMIKLFSTYPLNVARIFTDGWNGLYGSDFPWISWSYRPLEMLLDAGIIRLFQASEFPLFFFKASIIGLCAVLIYFLVRELTQKPWVAIASAVFSVFSIPVIIESWWYHHVVGYTEALIMLGLLGYLRYRRLRKLRWLAVFWVCALVAPLIGEYGISLTLIVMANLIVDWIITKKVDWKLLAPLPVLLFFGVYSAFLPNLIIEQRLVFTSVFDRFIAGVVFEQGLAGGILPGTAYVLVISAVSPIITLLAFIAMVTHYWQKRSKYSNWEVVGLGLFFIAVAIFIMNYPPRMLPWGDIAYEPFEPYYLLPCLFPVIFGLLCLRVNRFLALWFMLSYLPFVRIYSLSVNLIPALIPWITLIILWISQLADELDIRNLAHNLRRSRFKYTSIINILVIIILTIGVAAQLSNVAIARETWGKASINSREMGRFAAEYLPQGSIVLGEQNSFFETMVMSYYSDGKITEAIAVYDEYLWAPVKQVRRQELPAFLSATDNTSTEKYFLLQETAPQVLDRYLQVNPEQFEFVALFSKEARIILIDPLYLVLPKDLPHYMGFSLVHLRPYCYEPFYLEFIERYTLYKYKGR